MNYMYITPRTLLGIIRLAQALAKLHFRDEVDQKDVDRAIKLMDWSLKTLASQDKKADRKQSKALELLSSFRGFHK